MASKKSLVPVEPEAEAPPAVSGINTDRLVGPNPGDEPVYHKHIKGCRCVKCRQYRIKRGDS